MGDILLIMRIRDNKITRTRVTLTDPKTRKSIAFTVYDATAKQVAEVIKRAMAGEPSKVDAQLTA